MVVFLVLVLTVFYKARLDILRIVEYTKTYKFPTCLVDNTDLKGGFMLNAKAISLSFAATISILYLVCALFVYLWPMGFLSIINTWFHGIDLTIIAVAKPLALSGFFIGLVSIFIAGYVMAVVFSLIHNALSRFSKA